MIKKNNLILVTGGSGFIGTNLVNYLLKFNKFKIYNLDCTKYSSVPEKIKKINNKNYFNVKIDISNFKKLNIIIKKIKPNYIFHLAANSHVDRSIENPIKFINENVLSTTSLYSALLKIKNKKNFNLKKIIYLSTDEVYGSVNSSSDETEKLCPNSPYSASKASTDLISRSFVRTFGLPIVTARACNNFGPYQFSEKYIPNIISKFIKKKQVDIYGNGKNIREWLPVEHTCKALKFLMEKGKVGEIYNVGSKNSINNFKLFKLLEETFYKIKKIKKNNYQFVKDRPGHDLKYLLNSNKIRKEGFKNNFNFKSEIKKTILWYINNKNWLDYCEKKYQGQRIGLSSKI
jgi:dTDP-glucose 4,6-dehydratase